MSRQEPVLPEEPLKAAQRRIRELEIELQSLHLRLQQITTSRYWTVITFFRRLGYWLWSGPISERKRKAREFSKRVLRKTGLFPFAKWCARRVERIKHGLWQRLAATGIGPQATAKFLGNDGPHGYDVICLPMIVWDSRFQRPQQLMEQYARRGHRVFYASLAFCGGQTAQLWQWRQNVLGMRLPGPADIEIHRDLPSDVDLDRMVAAIDRVRVEAGIASAIVLVQLPFWTALAKRLREQFGWPVVYDCMDDHAGFATNSQHVLSEEQRTLAESDLVVTTSAVLDAKARATARRTALIRNACDYEHFAAVPSGAKQSGAAAPTIGFYGAIANWFDADLVAELAELRPGWNFELIGSTLLGDVSRPAKLPNVKFLGEKPYADLPRLVAGWDCFIVPFKRMPLTEATNPVKAYEMLATGKPVVAVDLPELRPMARDGLLSLADDARGFAAAIDRALTEDDDNRRRRRREFAAQNTWSSRCDDFDSAVRGLFPLASILIVTYNNLGLTEMCLESLFRETDYPNYEVIVIDNASHDGTPAWLAERAAGEPRLRVVCNADNRGFAGANNQGLRIARGEFLCLLNNDTVLTRGWLSTLVGHLRKSPKTGIVGPVSNMVGNEARIPVGYTAIADMPRWAADYCRRHDGETMLMKMLGFFCVVLSRDVFEKIGELDEQFGVGYFEDTDYCCRAASLGYEMRCSRDAFVHHWQSASFRLLGEDRHVHIFQQNQRLFEAKWGADAMSVVY